MHLYFVLLTAQVLLAATSLSNAQNAESINTDQIGSNPRQLQAVCTAEQQLITALIRNLDENLSENQLVFTDYSTVGFPSETLQLVEEQSVFARCFARNTIRGLALIDSESNGIQNGFYNFQLNERLVSAGGSFDAPKLEVFLFGDRQNCLENESRLQIAIIFDSFPSEILWTLLDETTQAEVLGSADTTVAGATVYTAEFAGNQLFIDRCLPFGDFTFFINDSAPSSTLYSVDLNGVRLRGGLVAGFESTSVVVQGPTQPPTAVPSGRPSSAPSNVPSASPSESPSTIPSSSPSTTPSGSPVTPGPMSIPTPLPTQQPTTAPPTTAAPIPTPEPTPSPVSPPPTAAPTTLAPTPDPTPDPTEVPPTPNPTALPPTPNPTEIPPTPFPAAPPAAPPAVTPFPVVIVRPTPNNGCANLNGACNNDFDCCSGSCNSNVCRSVNAPTPTFPPVPTFSAAPLPFYRIGAGGSGAGADHRPSTMKMERLPDQRRLVAVKKQERGKERSSRGINH